MKLVKKIEYQIWYNMLRRCENSKDKSYHDYGGRLIKVCKRWHKFENFFKDMGHKPNGKSLDRINNNGNYELSNCKWSTPAEQNNNCRPNTCGPNRQRWFCAINLNTGERLESNNQSVFARQHKLNSSTIGRHLRKEHRSPTYKKQGVYKGWVFRFLTCEDLYGSYT